MGDLCQLHVDPAHHTEVVHAEPRSKGKGQGHFPLHTITPSASQSLLPSPIPSVPLPGSPLVIFLSLYSFLPRDPPAENPLTDG